MSALPRPLHINLFGEGEGIVDLDADISDSAFDIGMSEHGGYAVIHEA